MTTTKPFAPTSLIYKALQPSANDPQNGLPHTAYSGLPQTNICGVRQTAFEVVGEALVWGAVLGYCDER